MKLNIPFEKEIQFDTNIYEICSISLEHEITKNEIDLLGNFIFSGTYKENELSVNETPFNFVVPFSVEFTNPIDTDSIEFTIDNFTYNVDDDKLIIKVDFIVLGNEIKREDNNELLNKDLRDDIIELPKENDEIHHNNTVLDDEFIIYHIHEIKEDESIETISNKYNTDTNNIISNNPNVEIKKGNRVIIQIDND